MDAPKVDTKQFLDGLQEELQTYLRSVIEAVNDAPDGEWITGSEEQVRDLSAEFRKRVFEQAVQQRIDAAEAAFSPSGRNDCRSGHTADSDSSAEEQGAAADSRADDQRSH